MSTIRIVVPIYNGVDILDICGPFAFFSSQSAAGLEPILASDTGKSVTTIQGIEINAQSTLKKVSGAEVIWVPGGFGDNYFNQFKKGNPLLNWLSAQATSAELFCTVCTGAHIAAAAGALDGYTVTTHWLFQKQLLSFPNITLTSGFPRYWVDRNRVTGGGISSGLDEALAVIAMLLNNDAAQQAQLLNQYAPDPPFNSGTPVTAPPKVLKEFFDANMNDQTDLQNAINAFLAGKK